MNTRRAFRLILFLLTLSSGVTLVSALHAAETVDVVIGPQAHRLTKFAADELAGQFTRLFGVEATVSSKVSASSSAIVCVGGPQDNPLIAKQLAKSWPKASNQGLVMESFKIDGKPALAVGGGSPRATLWAVYELGHRYGIRYLLREDIYPAAQPLNVAGIHVYQEPQFRDRTWRTVNDFAHGPESWGVADHQKLLRQLAKLKFNRVMLSVYPWQPFVHYELDGVAKQTGVLWYGERYRVNDDIPARTIFGGREFFENADFAEAATYDQRRAAGEAHLRGIIGAAHELGMSVGLSISPLEFPKEFSQVLPGAEKTHGLNGLVIAPSGQQGQHDKQLREMVRTKIRAYLETYPQLDALYLSLPEFPEWDAHAAASWSKLATRVDGAPQLGDLLRRAEQRPLIASGNRGRVAIQGNIVSLTFLRDLLAADRDLLRRADGKSLELRITAIDPDLLPYRKQLAPAGSHALNFIDYTARRIDLNSQYLAKADAKDGKHSLYMTLADDNVGVLPQSNVRRIDRLTRRIRELGWHGFATRYWDLAELDPAVVYLSRA
ncbi:MAG: alpha-glucuronidase family glycosyl hydrolase, partial [Pirellulaceae bacterium]|nr:alpha-glucuronidase family glycosyl hydrolase [Pirellulaceae bacterium]